MLDWRRRKTAGAALVPWFLGLSLGVVCLGIVACEGAESPPPAAPVEPPNFVVIVADTLRADRLHFAGHRSGRSPRFDALAAESVWFENVYSTTSWTLPSTASLFTSQLVSKHRVSSWGARLGADQPIFVDALDSAGYRTAMWTANRAIAGRRGFEARFQEAWLIEHPNFAQGSPLSETAFGRGDTISRLALDWLRDGKRVGDPAPFFVYLHYMEPHSPYLCADSDRDPACRAAADVLNLKLLTDDWALDPGEKALLAELYDADVTRMDAALSTLLGGLASEGLLENTWVVLVADHGELLGEAEMYMHGRTLFEAVVRVPLLIRSPDGRPGRIDTPISLIDLAPTILDLAGLPIPASFDGISLRDALAGNGPTARPIVSELLQLGADPDPRQRHIVSVRDGNEILRLGVDGRVERIDLGRDPSGVQSIGSADSAGSEANAGTPSEISDAERLYLLLESEGIDADPSLYDSPEYEAPSPEMVEHLKALGYLD